MNTYKYRIAFLAFAVALMCGCNGQKQEEAKDSTMNNELKAFDVQKDFEENGFTFFTKNLILCCGDSTENNAITIC